MLKKKKNEGFSLIEVVIGIAVITLVITAGAEVTRSSIKMGSITTNELIAHNLAEEGVEIVRNLRDSNWLRNNAWDAGLAADTYVIAPREQENFVGAPDAPPWKLVKKSEAPIREDERFKREIALSYEDVAIAAATANEPAAVQTQKLMHVKSTVSYDERGREKVIEFETTLTDWKQGPL